jgi:tetratricopeptide (TPR) repeat protein
MRFLLVLAAAAAFAAEDVDDSIARYAAESAAAMRSGDYASAERLNRAILKLDPKLAEASNNLGLACFVQKKYVEAARAFEAGLKLKPEMANAWLLLGITRFNLNRPGDAIPALSKYTGMRGDDLQGHYFLGLSYLAL